MSHERVAVVRNCDQRLCLQIFASRMARGRGRGSAIAARWSGGRITTSPWDLPDVIGGCELARVVSLVEWWIMEVKVVKPVKLKLSLLLHLHVESLTHALSRHHHPESENGFLPVVALH